MKKCLLLVALLIVSQLNRVNAQEVPLFKVQDTVCVKQPVSILDYVIGAKSYYWGFCSGYTLDNPSGTNIGNPGSQIRKPGDIDVVKDPTTGNYYGFVTNTDTKEFLRLNYGNSLNNTPTITNLGNLTNVLPAFPTSVYPVRDTANWYVFITAGTTENNSCLARLDFGPSLDNNLPNIANMGNLHKMFNGPRGIVVTQDNGHWWGYLVNNTSSELVQLDFSNNISLTPVPFNLGNLAGALGSPTDIAMVHDDRSWYLFIPNMANSSLTRVDLGLYLGGNHPALNLGNINGFLNGPSAISITRDCGAWEAFVTDTANNQLIRINMPFITGPYTGYDYGNIGNQNYAVGLSRIIRDHDDVFAFTANVFDSTVSKIDFAQCHHSSVASSLDSIAPTYSYDTPGTYNIYLEVNSGLPDMTSYCKQITVLPIPHIDLTQDTTLCYGDSIRLHVFSDSASSILWSPSYNISDTFLNFTTVYPAYSQTYSVTLTYPDGCIADTAVTVYVSKVHADAGPDRTVSDAGKTILGGPGTSAGNYTYMWYPTQYLSDPNSANPTATVPTDITYYLKVVELNDTFKCTSMDTVVVKVRCADLVLPNAFHPGSPYPESNKFGILNREIIKLNYLRIYDRWGEEVFETSDPTQKWDGTINNKYAPAGVYIWEADGFCESGQRFTKTGNVTLIR
jgi:hypothetical protein